MANGRGDDFTPLVRLMRTVNSIHYPTRFAQVFFSKKPKKFPRVSPPDFAFGKEGGQACRSRPREIPHKSPALPDFYTAARAAAARPRPPCGREGVIAPGFPGTGGVSKGDSVPLRKQKRHPEGCLLQRLYQDALRTPGIWPL